MRETVLSEASSQRSVVSSQRSVVSSQRSVVSSQLSEVSCVKLISSRKVKKRGKKAGYLIEAPRSSKCSPTLIDATKYVHQKRGTGTGKLLVVSSKPADKADNAKKSSHSSTDSLTPSKSKKKKQGLLK